MQADLHHGAQCVAPPHRETFSFLWVFFPTQHLIFIHPFLVETPEIARRFHLLSTLHIGVIVFYADM